MKSAPAPAITALIVLFQGVPVFAEPLPTRGTLCIAAAEPSGTIDPGPDCVETSERAIPLDPDPEPRVFVWRSEDERRMVVGTVPSDTDLVLLEGSVLQLRLSGSRERGWPQRTAMQLGSSDGTVWHWSVEHPELLRELVASEGSYDLKISAPRHFPREQKRIVISDEQPLSLGTLDLVPHPSVFVRLMTAEHQPVLSATMLDPEGETLAFADAAGSIRWESEAKLPERVVFTSPELASRSVDLPQRLGDVDLGAVVLSRGGTLRLSFDRGVVGYEPLEIRLVEYSNVRDREELYVGREVRREELSSDATSIDIERLEPRRFALYVRGSEPLQQFAEFVTVGEARVTDHSPDIRPYSLEVEVFERDDRLAEVEVVIGTWTVPGPEWKGRISTDDRGRSEETMWQRGTLLAAPGPDPTSVEGFRVSESADRHRLRLRISTRTIEGRLVDAETRQPITATEVSHHWKSEDSEGIHRDRTDDEGSFSFTRLKKGQHTIIARVPDYEERSVSVDLPGDDDRATIELALRKAARLYLHVTDTGGRPVPSVAILWATGEDIHQRQMNDAAGLYSMPVEAVQVMRLLVAPPSGSFSYLDADLSRHGSTDRPLRVLIPPSAEPLTIRAVDSEGQPRSGVGIDLAHNGLPIPRRMLQSLALLQGVRFTTGPDGTVVFPNLPSGNYLVSGFEGWTPYYPEGQKQPASFLLAGPQQITLVERPRSSR